ncbi:MAG: chromosomal replication initiator protein DnaA [Candidatus Riflebacteria bacterium]|nr:chromosomal replication initiator protein DnaA [Candidatus Riflebacteria bacterium]
MTSSNNLADVWDQVVSDVKAEATTSQFEALIKPIRPLSLEGQKVHLAVPSGFIKENLERTLKAMLLRHLERVLKTTIELFIQVEPQAQGRSVESSTEPAEAPDALMTRANLNPKYHMEYYVVGANNKFAHAAALAVVKSPGEVYNPLFLWGAVGVGKTHLMQAIGHRILQAQPRKKIMYVTAETFTSEWIDALREASTKEFQRKYRTPDLLLIDDVQFFELKEQTQEAFFHTFNELYQKRKQIVLTSDRPPKALNRLQDRLVNRFESGLTADIKAPDLETREAILRELADRHGITIEAAPTSYLARQFTSNIRELEGSFNRVAAYASVHKTSITIPLVEAVLEDIKRQDKKKTPSAETITQSVAEYFQLKKEDLLAKRQDRKVVVPRQIAMYLIYEMAGLTLKQIGSFFGKKDHSTVIHACDKIKRELEEGGSIAETVKFLKLKFKEMGE